MTIDTDIRAIKELLAALNEKMDLLLANSETFSIMKLAEASLKEFIEQEPDIYSIDDVKVRYH